jgi:4-amino-4-deoxy-L-arabinose transferase-like glycosyltransferase
VTGRARRRSRRRYVLPLLIALVALAADLRLVDLDRNPPELFEDELSGAVSAWSIATTGHDVGRTVLPFMVTGLEIKQPLYFLTTIPFQAVLGHGSLAVRIPAVIFGIAAVLLMVWLLAILRAGMPVALMGGFLMAISPWAIHYARAGWEPASFLPFAIGGIGLLWLGLRDHRRGLTIVSAVVFAIGAYTYHPALLSNVVMASTVVAIRHRTLRRSDVVALGVGAAIAIVLLVPYALAALDPVFLARTRGISVFRDGASLEALWLAWSNYWAQWSPAFLLGGAAPNPRINPGPLVYVWTVPFFLAGLDRLVHRRRPEDVLLLAWLVVGALPAALTDDRTTPHAARGLLVLPALTAITAIGLGRGLRFVRRQAGPDRSRATILAGATVLAIAIVGVVTFYGYYLNAYVVRSANFWGYGSAAAIRAAAAEVPPGGTLCIATPDISGFTFAQHMALYLPAPPFTVVRGIDAPECRQPGTYVLALVSRELAPDVERVATIGDIEGQPKFVVGRVAGGS